MKHTKNKDVAVAFVRWLMDRPQYDSYFTANDGYLMGPTPYWEKHALWEKDQADAASRSPSVWPQRVARPAEPEGVRGAREVHHGRHVRPGHQGHEGPRTPPSGPRAS